jgi:hypothetical protein
MKVATLSPLPVGLLAWNSPDPTYTVVVKATFTIAADGRAMLAPQQEPLSLDRIGIEELYYGSDFAPRKGATDLFIVGHAHTALASSVIPLGLSAPGFSLRLHAVNDTAAKKIALDLRHVRRSAEDPASGVRLSPARTSVRGWMSRTVAPTFDFATFNAAPPEHRMAGLASDATLVFEGFFAGGPREVTLPHAEPCVYYVEKMDRPGEPVTMCCDTVWIDTDRETIVLCWRGEAPRVPHGDPMLIVSLMAGGRRPPYQEVRGRLDEAEWRPAVRQRDLEDPPLPNSMPFSDREPTLALQRGGHDKVLAEEEPTLVAHDIAPETATMAQQGFPALRKLANTINMVRDDPTPTSVTGVMQRSMEVSEVEPITLTDDCIDDDQPATLSLDQSPHSVSTAQTARIEPPLPFDTYKAIKTALKSGSRPMREVLREHGVDEAGWLALVTSIERG